MPTLCCNGFWILDFEPVLNCSELQVQSFTDLEVGQKAESCRPKNTELPNETAVWHMKNTLSFIHLCILTQFFLIIQLEQC